MSVSQKTGGFGLSSEGFVLGQGALWLVLATVAAAIFFWPGLNDLWSAWQVPQYSHGPLIPIISSYLFLRQMKDVPEQPGRVDARWPGVAVLLLAFTVGLVGNITRIEKLVALAVIIWVGGMILTSFGWRRGRQFWPPVLHLAFMMPLPFFLYWKVSLALQFVSSELGVAFIRFMDIPVYLEGNIIDLGTYKLHVAEACSGLQYLFPIMSFTYIFAVLYQGSIWHKAVLLLAAVPIAILMNSVRIGVIGVIVNSYGIEHAEGFMHYFEGWVVFMICILMMLVLARVMQRLSGDRRSMAEVLDLDFTGLGTQIARVRHVQPSLALLGTAGLFAAAAFLWNPLTAPAPPKIDRDPFLVFPRALGEWRGAPQPQLSREISEVLNADDYLNMIYEAPGMAAPVDLFIAWYRDQSRASIHSPEVCIPAGGWEMSKIEGREVVVETGSQSLAIPVNRAIIQKGLARRLVYYWFDQGGRRLTSDHVAKLYLTLDAITTGRTDGALVRVITPILPGEAPGAADARLAGMIGEAMPVLPRFIETDVPGAVPAGE